MSEDKRSPEEQRRIESVLERKEVLLRTINEFALKLLATPTTEELVWYVAREVVARMGFDDCVIYLVDRDRALLRQVAAIGVKNPHSNQIVNPLEIPIGQGVTGSVAQTAQPLIIDNLLEDSRYISDVEPALSELCVPLIIDGEVVGVIDSEDPRPGHYGREHLEVLTTVAAMTSAKLKIVAEARRAGERTDELRRLNDQLREEIIERERAEKELRAIEERFQDMTANVPGVVYQFKIDASGKASFPYVSPAIKGVLGIEAADIVDDPNIWFDIVHPEDRPGLDASIGETHRTLEPWLWEGRMIRSSGDVGWFQGASIPRKLHDRSVLWNGLVFDITERMCAEQELRDSRDQLRLIADNLPVNIVYLDRDLRFGFVNKTTEERYGRPAAEIVGKSVQEVLLEDNWKKLKPYLERSLGGETVLFEETLAYPDGKMRDSEITYVPHFGEDGRVLGICVLSSDVTEQKRAEEQLHQAQKMEAVGQLTGGVAHDFNNLLAVIQGNAELLADTLEAEDPFTPTILRASKRGAELTQRLLAFSRQQPLQPKSVDLAALVGEMSDLLKRSLGETIEIETTAEPALWPVSADPGQVENALLNLSINARDAMPGGGKLTIECANAQLDEAYVAENPEAKVGDYAVLAVTDSGAGMSAEVQKHAFEPFFTTKKVGEGSGLGLSMIYGFTKQSGGHVIIYSEEGQGTTVKLYLPRDRAVAQRTDKVEAAEMPRGRGELVLVIEDDTDLRELAAKMLKGLGYRVIAVTETASAREALEQGDRIDLVLSDVVLPGGMSGPEFAEEATERYPDLKIIFMSGYPADAAKNNGFLSSDKVLLNKPFQRRRLAKAVRDAID